MRIVSLTVCLAILTQVLHAQSKHDYTWVLGYSHHFVDPNGIVIGGTFIDFNQTPYLMSHAGLPTFEVVASISDQNGQLIAYTDGCRVANADNEVMLHGDTISPGYVMITTAMEVLTPVMKALFLCLGPVIRPNMYFFISEGQNCTYFQGICYIRLSMLKATMVRVP